MIIHESILDWEQTEKIHYVAPSAIKRMETEDGYAKVYVDDVDGKLKRIDTKDKSEIETIKELLGV